MTVAEMMAALVMGLVGTVHCVGMCGGMAAGIKMTSAPQQSTASMLTVYNLGRLSSYFFIGILFASLGVAVYQQIPSSLNYIRVFAAILLISMGLYVMKLPNVLPYLELVGSHLWRKVQPLTRRLLPLKSKRQAWLLGMLWGFLPCGLVYSALSLSAAQSTPLQGGGIMLAFGLGTLPSMLALGFVGEKVMQIRQNKIFQLVAGLLLIGYGIYLLMHLLTMPVDLNGEMAGENAHHHLLH